MAGLDAAWSGLAEMEAALAKLNAQADLASKTIVSKSSALLISTAQKHFEGTRARVQHHIVPKNHIGGSLPNVISGSLRRSNKADPIRRYGQSDWGTQVGPRMIYSRRIDHLYPFWTPSVAEATPGIAEIAETTWAAFLA